MLDAFKNAASTIKRNFQKQKTILDRYYNQQMELIGGQMTNIESLYGIIKQDIVKDLMKQHYQCDAIYH